MSDAARLDRSVPKPQRLSAPECWARWRLVLSGFEQHARAVLTSGGDEIAFAPELRHEFAALGRVPFPVEGVCGDVMGRAFRLQAQALIDVALPARRIAVAHGVLGSVQALEGLVHAEQLRAADVWRTRMGSGV